MKVSTKGRYGLRAMINLAANSNGEYLPLHIIAESEGISERYLEQVFSTLKKTGLVKSVKGAQGGYALTKKPSEISVLDILIALEGDLSVVDDSGNNSIIRECIGLNVWEKMNQAINKVTSTTTLDMLVRKYKKAQGVEEILYYI